MPFLNLESSRNRKIMTKVINRAERTLKIEQSQTYSFFGDSDDFDDEDDRDSKEIRESADECLIRAYLRKTEGGLHVRRTLDQSYYSMLPSTEERDVDQILIKRIKDKGGSLKVVMVDQLWLWLFDGMPGS